MTTRRTVLVGARFHVDRFEIVGRDGSVTTRELCVHPGAVVLLPILDDGRIVLIANERPMLARTLIELPAGTIEPGEVPLACAARELTEETGYRARTIEPLLGFFASPGITDEWMHVFAARGLERDAQHLDSVESIEVRETSLEDALAMIRDGTIVDAKTIAVLLHHVTFGAG